MNQAIEFLSQQLNQGLRSKFDLSEDLVIIGKLVNANGSVPLENQNKLVLSLVNLTTDVTYHTYNKKMGFAGGHQVETPPLFLNLDLLISGNFSDELETAKFLTAAIQFFHEHPQFERNNAPSLPSELNKITMEMHNLSLSELNDLWGAIGTGMIPSAMYKVRVM